MTTTIEEAKALGFESIEQCEKHQKWLEQRRLKDSTCSLRIAGATFLTGDRLSVSVIFCNLAGLNKMEDHATYLKMMEMETQTQLSGLPLEMFDNNGLVVNSAVVPNYKDLEESLHVRQ